jgi:acyl-coenzyme A synthetase/AMP-(fatty) acid ligase
LISVDRDTAPKITLARSRCRRANTLEMLEQRWRSTVDRFRNSLAVHEVASGRTWTFRELAAAADALGTPSDPILFPKGNGIPFLLTVLQAWRTRTPLCPLEPSQPIPTIPTPGAPIAHLKSTSGSTGAPRWVALTASQIAADADQIVDTMQLSADCPNVGVLSLAHSYGYSNLVTPLFLHGIPLILAASGLPTAVLAAAQLAPRITLPAVPALWSTWHQTDAIPANVHLAISAGAPLPHALERDVLEQRGLKIHNFLGASECGGIAFDQSHTLRPDPTCVGTALNGVRLSTDADGALIIQSPAVAQSYFPTPAPALEHPTFQSADLVSIDDDGILRIRGRASDLINVAGRKVAPETIEQALLTHPAIRDCLVLGLPDDDARGESIGVVYDLRSPVPETELRTFLQRTLPAWQLPRRWWLRPDLGVDHRGKRSRAVWRARILTPAA